MPRNRVFLGVSSLIVGLSACDAEDTVVDASAVPSFEEFEAQSRAVVDGQTVYVAEGDLLFQSREAFEDYYDETYGSGFRSIVNMVNGVRDIRNDPMNITYCFVAGWGQNQGSYTAPTQASIQGNIEAAMDAWEAVAAIQFVHRADLDGAACSTTGANAVSFAVRHIDRTNGNDIAYGSFPSTPAADQGLFVPPGGLSLSLAIHEVGHILGLRHEHIHSDAVPRCSEGGVEGFDYEELTAFDSQSAMIYANCLNGPWIGGFPVSALDAAGVAELYGPPSGNSGVSCELNGGNAQYGGFGIHNAYVENTSGVAQQGFSVEVDFGSATPQVGWSWGASVTASGNRLIISGTQTLQPGQRVYFGTGGNYVGPTFVPLTCE